MGELTTLITFIHRNLSSNYIYILKFICLLKTTQIQILPTSVRAKVPKNKIRIQMESAALLILTNASTSWKVLKLNLLRNHFQVPKRRQLSPILFVRNFANVNRGPNKEK